MELQWGAWFALGSGLLLVGATALVDKALKLAGRSDVRKLAQQGDPRAHTLDAVLRDRRRWTVTATLLKAAGLVLIAVGFALEASTALSVGWLVVVTVGLWLAIGVVQVGGRALGTRAPLASALRMATLAQAAQWLLRPASSLLLALTNALGAEDTTDDDAILLSDDGVRLMLSGDEDNSEIEDSEKEMIASILEMDETVAREVMVPRIDMVAVEADAPIHEALDALLNAGHSRLPVYEDDVDHVVGLLYAKDLLACFHRGEVNVPVRSLLRPAYFVPLTKNVKALLADMRKHRVHMAIVVDEYGGTAGLVTIEDILEEIVGEIQDEYDAVEIAMVKPVGANSYLANARVDIYSLGKLLRADLDDEDADTLGGLILSLLGHVPEAGEAVEHQSWRFTVLAVDGRRIDQVRIEPVGQPDGDPAIVGPVRPSGPRLDSQTDASQPSTPGAFNYLPTDPPRR